MNKQKALEALKRYKENNLSQRDFEVRKKKQEISQADKAQKNIDETYKTQKNFGGKGWGGP